MTHPFPLCNQVDIFCSTLPGQILLISICPFILFLRPVKVPHLHATRINPMIIYPSGLLEGEYRPVYKRSKKLR
jgi:hypothetical protein